jgi:isoleucyl-tRNA synthetase
VPNALKPVLPMIDDASNWYVRRSRRRFWKSDNDSDKQAAYKTLHYVLVQLSLILAPFTPFLTDEMFRRLTGGESVHLCDWPAAGRINQLVLKLMESSREAITLGLAQRAEAGIKVRQPLSSVKLAGVFDIGEPKEIYQDYLDIIMEELNVKNVELINAKDGEIKVEMDLNISDELKKEGLMREVIRQVQQARKSAGLQVDDRIELGLSAEDDELRSVLNTAKFRDVIAKETLATSLKIDQTLGSYRATVKVEGADLGLSLGLVAGE